MPEDSVILEEDDLSAAKRLCRVCGPDLIATVLELQNTNELRSLSEGVQCTTCGVQPRIHCTTRNGGRARRPHANRLVLFLAVIFALEKQIVIQEEDDIEDFL